MHSVCADLQVFDGDHAYQLVEIHVELQSDLLLVFTLISVPNRWDLMCAHNEIHAPPYPCM